MTSLVRVAAILAIALPVWATVAGGQCETAGECFCDERGTIGIAQLVRGVNVVLGLASCPASPPTPNPTNTPTHSPTRTPTRTPTEIVSTCADPPSGASPICGDGVCHLPEQCDIGGICVGGSNDLAPCTSPSDCPGGKCTVVTGRRAVGDDTCSANCTIANVRTAAFGSESEALIQTVGFAVPFEIKGSQTFRIGAPRPDATIDINGEVTFGPDDVPVVSRPDDINIEPSIIPSLVCACVRGIEVPAFGASIAGAGVISCGNTRNNTDITTIQDHHTDPLSGFEIVPECSLAADPECDDVRETVFGVHSSAFRERPIPDSAHEGVCNSPQQLEFSGSGPRGSALMFTNTAIGLLSDAGTCDMSIAGQSPCPEPSYGPDCIPCTDDDLDLGVPLIYALTTGTAQGIVYNARNIAGEVITHGTQTPCRNDNDCPALCGTPEACFPGNPPAGGGFCAPRCGGSHCQTRQQGTPFDCVELLNSSSVGLQGGTLVLSSPVIDALLIGDNVTSMKFAFD